MPWPLGPADGRYVVRGHAGVVDRVLVLATLGAAPRAGRLRGRRAKPVEPGAGPEPVATGRATLIEPEPLADPERWLRDADGEALAGEAVGLLNHVLHAHRVATADPWSREVAREQALVVRIGFGEGEQVADGRWASALTLPPAPPARRLAALRPTERLAAVLGGHDVVLACEELVLRARQDLTAGRAREAALQADVALRTALAELAAWRGQGDLATRVDELAGMAAPVGEAAARALQGGLAEGDGERVEQAVRRLEAALRARSATGF